MIKYYQKMWALATRTRLGVGLQQHKVLFSTGNDPKSDKEPKQDEKDSLKNKKVSF